MQSTLTKTRSTTGKITYPQVEELELEKMLALGQLACGIAHEVNNQLGAALGYLQLAREEQLFRGEAVDYIVRTEERIQQAAKIVREVREFGAPTSPDLKPVNIHQLLQEALDLLQVGGIPGNITISQELASGLLPVLADGSRLIQVFLNLVQNAQEAMPEGGKICIRSRQARDKIQITISDTGAGIAKEDLPRIFEPFFTTKLGKGMGMGLAVSYRIIQEHKGNIEVQSQKGKGTTFTVTLPVAAKNTGQGSKKDA